MTDRQSDRSMRDVLTKVDADLAKYIPKPNVRERVVTQPPPPSAELMSASEATAITIIKAVEEIEAQSKRLRERAEHCIKQLKDWTTQFEAERAQLLQLHNELDTTVNGIIESILEVGKARVASKGESEHE
jgi:hypothetical protein